MPQYIDHKIREQIKNEQRTNDIQQIKNNIINNQKIQYEDSTSNYEDEDTENNFEDLMLSNDEDRYLIS